MGQLQITQKLLIIMIPFQFSSDWGAKTIELIEETLEPGVINIKYK